MRKSRMQGGILILVSSGFNEESVIACIKQLRGSGLEVKVVGLTAGLLVGAHGLTIRPDITLADLGTQIGYRLVIVPGCAQSAGSMLADPRVHQLFANAIRTGGRVAVMNTAETAFIQAGFLEMLAGDRVLVQGRQDTADFIDHLARMAIG